jgi:hypothetical protein
LVAEREVAERERMQVPQVYLHYLNVNVEGQLPHALEFGSLYGRLVTERELNGRVVTVLSCGMPRRYYVWSTFAARMRVQEVGGKTVVQGEGWHLCPPREVPEKNIKMLVNGNLTDHQFIDIVDKRVAIWLLKIAHRFKPPGDPNKIRAFLKKLWGEIGNEKIEANIQRVLRNMGKS